MNSASAVSEDDAHRSTDTGVRLLTTAEAAARLGVKTATLYAYVSRGLLDRITGPDGRTSLYAPADIDAFRAGRRTDTRGELHTLIATSITKVGDDGLRIRNTDIADLIRSADGFVDVVEHLWGVDPEPWPAPRTFAQTVGLDPIAALRMAVVLGGAADPIRHDRSSRAVAAMGRSMIVDMTHAVAPRTGSPTDGQSSTIAAQLWGGLSDDEPTSAQIRAVDTMLALLVDHGLASSTFAVRVAASARADPYSAVLAGLGVLGGTLHGAASAAVHDLFVDAQETDVSSAIGRAQQRLGRTPGWGHAVYTTADPRFGLLMARVLDAWGDDRRIHTIQRIRDTVNARTGAIENIDLAIGSLTWLSGMAPSAGEVFFAIARTAGWLAHAMEEYGEAELRFRPKARYV